MNATFEPTRSGRSVFHSTDSMLVYQRGTLSGSDAYAATASGGRLMTISLETSIADASLLAAVKPQRSVNFTVTVTMPSYGNGVYCHCLTAAMAARSKSGDSDCRILISPIAPSG